MLKNFRTKNLRIFNIMCTRVCVYVCNHFLNELIQVLTHEYKCFFFFCVFSYEYKNKCDNTNINKNRRVFIYTEYSKICDKNFNDKFILGN